MNIMVVLPPGTKKGPPMVHFGDDTIWIRDATHAMRSLTPDVVVLAPGVTDEQRQIAFEKTRPVRGRVFELVELTASADFWNEPLHPGL